MTIVDLVPKDNCDLPAAAGNLLDSISRDVCHLPTAKLRHFQCWGKFTDYFSGLISPPGVCVSVCLSV